MSFKTFILFVGLTVSTIPAWAQRVEASVNVGYGASEGISSSEPPLLGQLYDSIGPKSGGVYGFTFGVFATEHVEIEFLFARQSSELVADGAAGERTAAELAIYNYHGNIVYNFGARDARVRPFLFGGVGATQYDFGAALLFPPADQAPRELGDDSRLSSTWGGGLKMYFSDHVGARATARWTPTYIKSDPAGVWCDPFYGCWPVADAEYSNQLEFTAGLTIRFDD